MVISLAPRLSRNTLRDLLSTPHPPLQIPHRFLLHRCLQLHNLPAPTPSFTIPTIRLPSDLARYRAAALRTHSATPPGFATALILLLEPILEVCPSEAAAKIRLRLPPRIPGARRTNLFCFQHGRLCNILSTPFR